MQWSVRLHERMIRHKFLTEVKSLFLIGPARSQFVANPTVAEQKKSEDGYRTFLDARIGSTRRPRRPNQPSWSRRPPPAAAKPSPVVEIANTPRSLTTSAR